MKNEICFGIVGTNFISDWFVEAAALVDGVKIGAVYSRKYDTGAAFAEKHGIKRIFTSYPEMLLCDEINAVYVASPTQLHKEHSVLAMKHGKAVLCEKMIAATNSDFLEMHGAAIENGGILIEAMRPLFDPAYAKVRELLSEIGPVRRVMLEYCQYSSRYDNFKAGIIENAFKTEMKNSALADIGIYPLNTCVALFGEPKGIKSSSVFLSNGFEGAGNALLEYDGFTACISYSKISQSAAQSQIEGEYGTLFIDKISSPKKLTLLFRTGEERVYDLNSPCGNLNMKYETEAMRDIIRGEIDPMPYLKHTAAVMRCVDAIYTSSGVTFPEE